jgi:DivIVA domain-containing protein
MIDLTPLDVRKKKGDFRRGLRGYEPEAVDEFLDLVAERLEELVRENGALKERVHAINEAVTAYRERERAMNDALVSAQQLREDMRTQATRDAEVVTREASAEAERILAEARGRASAEAESMRRVQTQRAWFLKSFRAFVERQLGEIEQEEERLRELVRADAVADVADVSQSSAREPEPEPADTPVGGPAWLAEIDRGGAI